MFRCVSLCAVLGKIVSFHGVWCLCCVMLLCADMLCGVLCGVMCLCAVIWVL